MLIFRETKSVGSAEEINGYSAFPINTKDQGAEKLEATKYYTITETGIYLVRSVNHGKYETRNFSPPLLILPKTMCVGDHVLKVAQSDAGAAITSHIWLLGVEDMTIDGFTYVDTLKFFIYVTENVRGKLEKELKTMWFEKGIGFVRNNEIKVAMDDGTEMIEFEEEVMNNAIIDGTLHKNGIGKRGSLSTGPFDLTEYFPLSTGNIWVRTITELEYQEKRRW